MILLLVLFLNADSLLADTQGNEAVWTDYIETHSGETLLCCLYLLENIPRLDRLEMTSEVLDDQILSSLSHREGIPDSIFYSGLLWYRTATEPVTPFRCELSLFLDEEGIDEPAGVVSWTEDNLSVFPVRYLGGMEGPMGVLGAGGGTEGEIRVFQAASIRSLGYPVRTVSGWFTGSSGGERSWLEIWQEGEWIPLEEDFESLVLAVDRSTGEYLTKSYTETGMLVTIPPDTAAGSFMLSINIPVAGRYLPLDWAMPFSDQPDTMHLGQGELLLILSRRLPSGAVEVWNTFRTIEQGDTVVWNSEDVVLPVL